MNNLPSYLKNVNLNEFEAIFGDLLASKTSFFGYYYGGYDSEGKSWCSDCVQSKPIIEEAVKILEGQDKIKLYKFPVDDVKEWKKQDFIFRVHPKVKVTRVPTLVYYSNGIEYGRLIEDELFDSSNVKEFIKQSLE